MLVKTIGFFFFLKIKLLKNNVKIKKKKQYSHLCHINYTTFSNLKHEIPSATYEQTEPKFSMPFKEPISN
jgi:hypothetical protein